MSEETIKHSFIHIKSRRFHVTLLLMVGVCLFFFARTNLGLSMVCMINSTAVNLENFNINSNKTIEIPNKCIKVSFINNSYEEKTKNYGGTFDWNINVQSLILSGNFYGAILTIVPAGILADRSSPKNLLLISSAFFFVASVLFPYLAYNYSYTPLIISRIIMGLGEGISSPAFNHILSNWIPKAESPVAISIYTSGVQLACFIGNPITAYFCESTFGWSGVFYLLSFCLIIWSLLWYITVQNKFHKAKWMHETERIYLEKYMTTHKNKGVSKKFSIPLKSMITSLPLISTLLCNFFAMMYNFFVTMYLPTYFKDTLYVSIMNNGLYSSLPFIAQGISKIGWGYFMTHLQRKNILTSTQSVKLTQILSGLGVSIGFYILPLLNDCTKPYLSVGCFIWISTFFGISASGFLVSHIILAPAIIGFVSSIFNVTGILGAIFSPWLVSSLKNHNDPNGWDVVLYVLGSLWLLSSIFFFLFGSGEPQSWGLKKELHQDDLLLNNKNNKNVSLILNETNL
ncbi:Sialin [Strongyloides ratti]|uniref:Sialin n=1 Tax=Strongyloides ratti TaxID=34506 RepID=A0A090N021_STRRB|nr:Sialin [Strongyloides ratti]CEF69925.1 Sialin [Strongyloides ratti]